MSIRFDAGRVAALREAFDRSFARPPAADEEGGDEMLAVRIAGDPYVVSLVDVAGVQQRRKVARVPSDVPELLGIASFRSVVVPVYDLGALIGRSARADAGALLLGRAPSPVAFSVGSVDGRLHAKPRDRVALASHAEGLRHLSGAVLLGEAMVPLIDLASVLAALSERIAKRAAPARSGKDG